MAKVRKRYNKFKSVEKVAKAGLKNLVITFNAEEESCKVRNSHTGKSVVVSRNMFNAIWQIRYKWGLYLAALIKEKNGKEAYVWAEVDSPFPVYHEEINDSLSEQHAAFTAKEKANGNQVINLGWIASHEGLSLNTSSVEFLLEAAGV